MNNNISEILVKINISANFKSIFNKIHSSRSFIRKISANLILIMILVSITIGFFYNFDYRRGQFDQEKQLWNKSDNEARLIYDTNYELFEFVINHVEEGSIVLFIEYYYFYFGQPYLYPKIESKIIPYSNRTDDEDMLGQIEEISIDYILVTIEQSSNFWNSSCFSIVDYYSDEIFLLKVN